MFFQATNRLIVDQPTLCVMYFLNYVDRNAIAQARLNDLEEDLGMSGVQFNTCVSMLVFFPFVSDIITRPLYQKLLFPSWKKLG